MALSTPGGWQCPSQPVVQAKVAAPYLKLQGQGQGQVKVRVMVRVKVKGGYCGGQGGVRHGVRA